MMHKYILAFGLDALAGCSVAYVRVKPLKHEVRCELAWLRMGRWQ